jgi:hypothetical protein
MTYFVSKRNSSTEPFRVVYREVKTRTHKGYPLTYELCSLPEAYATWEEAVAAIEKLNSTPAPAGAIGGAFPTWL